jgi:phage terminase large subunit-like protein
MDGRKNEVVLLEKRCLRSVARRVRRIERQLLNMSSAGYVGAKSPDRLDALVWALLELMLAPQTLRPS